MAIKRKNSNKEWIIDQNAIETSIIDIEGNFESNNVEGALRELAQGVKKGQDLSALESKIESNRQGILSNAERLATAEENIDYLLIHGGGGSGGGGSALPTITSTFKDATVEKGQDVDIPIFFSSPNMGSGTAYILVNNIQVHSSGVSQGNNIITIKSTHLAKQTENLVGIYVKDRAYILFNQLI